MGEATGGPGSGLGPMLREKANCQEEKGARPLKCKVSFEKGGGQRNRSQVCENVFHVSEPARS